MGLGDYSSPKLVYSSSDCQPSPSYFCRHHPSTDGRLSPEPSQADLGLFSHSYFPEKNCPSKEDQYKTATLVQGVAALFALPLGKTQQTAAKLRELAPSMTMSCLYSSWQGSWRASLSRRNSFLLTADSAWKSRKKKGITLANTGDPEISQPIDILPF